MANIIIVENLGKKYLLNHQAQQGGYVALRDVLADGVKSCGRWLAGRSCKTKDCSEEFWALKDVSFEVKQGDRIGIIGRNGAGKSTLLKILSRITEPTTGSVRIKGRVASLLEVGTGFHPELTGRENIYLNGAILGMGRSEIRKKFDEIVDFAEIEKFLDTPVKRYSSGMYVRLAFAVAAHLEPEILIVDEVLAVGDAQFQKKCLGKMEDVGREGRTILFVTHNMSMTSSLCTSAVLLDEGKIVDQNAVDIVIAQYFQKSFTVSDFSKLLHRKDRVGTGRAQFRSLRILNQNGDEVSVLESGGNYIFEIGYENNFGKSINNVCISLDFYDQYGNRILLFRNNFVGTFLDLKSIRGKVNCTIHNLPLALGKYQVSLYMSHSDHETLDFIERVGCFNVDGGDFFGTGSSGLPNHCKVLMLSSWSIDHEY